MKLQRIVFAIAAALFFLVTNTAHVADTVERRVLGPAFSHHATLDGSWFKAKSNWSCYKYKNSTFPDGKYDYHLESKTTLKSVIKYTEDILKPGIMIDDGRPVGPDSEARIVSASDAFIKLMDAKSDGLGLYYGIKHGTPGLAFSYVFTAGTGYIADSVSGIKTLTSVTCDTANSTWTNNWSKKNLGIGLQRTTRTDTHADHVFLDAVYDSYHQPSLMLGAGRTWPIAKFGSLRIEGGAIGGLWSRSYIRADDNDAHRSLMPFVMPMLQITEEITGLGVSIVAAPRLQISGRLYVPTTTYMLQTSYRILSSDKPGINILGFDFKPGGGTIKVAGTF